VLAIAISVEPAFPQSVPAKVKAGEPAGLRVLLVIAHPDDEYEMAGTVYRITKELSGTVDQLIMNQTTFVERQDDFTSLQEEYPLTVREAAKYLGVSPQSVYLWVERKQIPHLRVMGRNIRFLKSDLETFRASFKQEMENA
jgi:excisionase family DNA binding protein